MVPLSTVHTILLVQPLPHPSSRTYYDFETIAGAMDHIAGMYEQHLQRENPDLGQIQYRAEDLFHFIDTYKEFVALVFEPSQQTYAPRDKQWIKNRLLAHFSRPAGGQGRQQNQYHRGGRGGGYARRGGGRRW
ncbi:hypothetical protein VTP01DRAFT_10407 [Rhizomucor pusillus]|uniref:uncharacterized protein n=1 Tax=Rhizomucor pusillus TaxID=4840 RepID=UPI0037437262